MNPDKKGIVSLNKYLDCPVTNEIFNFLNGGIAETITDNKLQNEDK